VKPQVQQTLQPRYVLRGLARLETQVRKSRFLALAQPVRSTDEAMAFLATQRYADATHHCWAYRVDDHYRFYDDGEPGGTAGRPILQAIDGQQCDRVVVVVVRWFGGVKLGTGGLARAYGGTAAQCLRLAEKTVLVDTVRVDCTCAFADMALVRARLGGFDAHIVQEQFDAHGVVWCMELPRARVHAFVAALMQLTRGQCGVQIGDGSDGHPAIPHADALLGEKGEFHHE